MLVTFGEVVVRFEQSYELFNPLTKSITTLLKKEWKKNCEATVKGKGQGKILETLENAYLITMDDFQKFMTQNEPKLCKTSPTWPPTLRLHSITYLLVKIRKKIHYTNSIYTAENIEP